MTSIISILGVEPDDAWLASEDASRLESIALREQIYACLHDRPRHPALLRRLLEHEVELRRGVPDTDAFENLYWCALLLHQLGRLEDVLALWRAKNINMDTGVGLDAEFLVGAGVRETLAYLASSTDPDAAKAHAYIGLPRRRGLRRPRVLAGSSPQVLRSQLKEARGPRHRELVRFRASVKACRRSG